MHRLVESSAIVLSIVAIVSCHVRLQYPSARFPQLDFIENGHTPEPCGVSKKSQGTRTWLQAGKTLNVTWLLQLPHPGGHRIELLDETDRTLAILSPTEHFISTNDATNNFEAVMLPENFECFNCAIRLVRQAIEVPGQLYYSCADVNIVKGSIPDGDTCLGNGKRMNGSCQCDRLFNGESCQLKDECVSDADCGNGQCVFVSEHTEPRRQCYCNLGFFGEFCRHPSSALQRDRDFDPSLYNLREASSNKIYWRIIQDELEVVMKFPGSSWVGLGWKPKGIRDKCPSVSNLEPSAIGHSSSLSTIASTSAPSSSFSSVSVLPVLPTRAPSSPPVNRSKSCNDELEQFSDCPDTTRDCEASCDWTRLPETIPNCSRSCGQPRCICKEGYVRKTNNDQQCVPFDYCQLEPVSETVTTTTTTTKKVIEKVCPENATWAKCGLACEPTCENMYDTTPCQASCDTPACTCADNFVRHKDHCIYWGHCPNLDAQYTTSTLSPPPAARTASISASPSPSPSVVPISTTSTLTSTSTGQITSSSSSSEDMNCAVNETINQCGKICEPDCVTIFVRESCSECATPSCACLQGYARTNGHCIYWGDCPLDVSGLQTASPKTEKSVKASADKTVTVDKATPTEELTSQGGLVEELGATDKTTTVLGDVCYGDWRWPIGCRDCDYRVSWNYLDETDEIEFSIETRAPSNWWTGIGFSSTGTMVEADMIVVKSRGGNLTLHDMYSSGYGVPKEDAEQNVYTPTVVGTHVNGVLRAQFTRKRDTGDKRADHRFADGQCYNFLFPVSGGRLDSDGRITKHISTPMVSATKVCIRSCTKPDQLQASSTCESEFRYPTGCEGNACDYVARWEYNETRNDVGFEVSAKGQGRWTGIGFSRDGNMANSDVYTGWVYDGKAYVTDRFAYGRQLPAIDPADRQDIYEVAGKMEDEIQTIMFRRKVLPADTITDFPLNKCYYFLYPIGGGRVLARKSQDFQSARTPIGYHDLYLPKVSRTKICLCNDGVPLAEETTSRRHRRESDPFNVEVDPFIDVQNGSISRNKIDEPEPQPEPEPSPNGDEDGGMDCADMVIATVGEHGLFDVRDYYTISHATPRLDAFYGGSQSLTAASAYRQDGITTVVFRKKLRGGDVADHDILPGPMTVIWAKGTSADTYEPPSGHSVFKQQLAGNSEFFERNVLKYHGSNNRGLMTIDFYDTMTQKKSTVSEMCHGKYTNGANYSISWISDGKTASFSIHARLPKEHWTGVGFSRDGAMANADLIVTAVQSDSSITVTDQYSPGYGRPSIDTDQGIFDISTHYDNDQLWSNFSRPIESKDDQDLPLDGCFFMLFPFSGGSLDGGSGDLQKHIHTPASQQVCFESCKPDPTRVKKPKTHAAVLTAGAMPTAGATKYAMNFRILNKMWQNDLEDSTSKPYTTIADQINRAVQKAVHEKWPEMNVELDKLNKDRGLVAHVRLSTDSTDAPTAMQLKSQMENVAARGLIETLQIEPTTIKAQKLDRASIDSNPIEIWTWLALAGAVALFLLALICTTCLLCRLNSHKRGKMSSASSRFVPFASYSYTCNANYPAMYPVGAFQYPTPPGAPVTEKNSKGFENQAFNQNHTRQFSQATTASPPAKTSPSSSEQSPAGVGETTYHEWLNKVANKPGVQQHQEAPIPRNNGHRSPFSPTTPYVSYPNDPIGYYTIGGEHRFAPPGYNRHF